MNFFLAILNAGIDYFAEDMSESELTVITRKPKSFQPSRLVSATVRKKSFKAYSKNYPLILIKKYTKELNSIF